MPENKCIICAGRLRPFFEKNFHNNYNLSIVKYSECINCGLVVSQTHFDMDTKEWEQLNKLYHEGYQYLEYNPDEPRWIDRLQKQAQIIEELHKWDILPTELPWLDYGCGNGLLSKFLLDKNKITLFNYDEYMMGDNHLKSNELIKKRFDLVICNAVFEHLLKIKDFNNIESLVSGSGVFIIHTRVCERIPCDPSWFYLLPVHCSFHTNKSMQILFEKWGYNFSIYNKEAGLWFWFKQKEKLNRNILQKIEKSESYFYKQGFVDYWKTVG